MQIAFMAFQGAEDDGIYYQHSQNYSPNNGRSFSEVFISDRTGVETFNTSTRPSLLQVGGSMYMAWKGINNDPKIWISKFTADPAAAPLFPGLTVSAAMAGWQNNVVVGGVPSGTSFGPSLATWQSGAIMVWVDAANTNVWYGLFDAQMDFNVVQKQTGIRSQYTPAIVNFNGTLIMVWRGEGSDDALYWATSQNPASWTHHGAIPQAASTSQPALTVFNGNVFLAFKGLDTDIYMTQIANVSLLPSNAQWNVRYPIPAVGTAAGPSLCVLNSELFMAWRGDPGDTAIWYSSSPTGAANAWAPQQTLGHGPPGDPQSLNYGSSFGPAVATFTR